MRSCGSCAQRVASEGDDGCRNPRRSVPHHVGYGHRSEVMQRVAAPMVGGMITAPLLSMFVVPADLSCLMWRRRAGHAASMLNKCRGGKNRTSTPAIFLSHRFTWLDALRSVAPVVAVLWVLCQICSCGCATHPARALSVK